MGKLSKLIMSISSAEGEELTYNRSSLLHGVIMERISGAYAEVMHREGMKPYSQSVLRLKDQTIWQINSLTEEAYENLIVPLLSDDFHSFELKHNGTAYGISEKQLIMASTEKLIEDYYLGECERRISILFQTPTAFRQQGQYVFYPDLRLIFSSLMNRYDQFEENQSMRSEETLDQLTEHTRITGYNVRSHLFSLEGARIPSFTGRINLRISGPSQLVNLIHLLLHYGEFSGVGIKTAIGMGRVQVAERRMECDRK